MVDRIRYPTVSYLPFYYIFFQFLFLTIFNLQAKILAIKDILSNLATNHFRGGLSGPHRFLGLLYTTFHTLGGGFAQRKVFGYDP